MIIDLKLNKKINAFKQETIDWYYNRLSLDLKLDNSLTLSFDKSNDKIYHHGFIEYIARAYNNHYGIEISPHVIWYVILTELAKHIKDNVEYYRSHFTKSLEKIDIKIPDDDIKLNFQLIINQLESLVPLNINIVIPEFSTTTEKSRYATYAAFCDAVSPYYSYSMFACGIAYVDLVGTLTDWKLIKSNLEFLNTILTKAHQYINQVISQIDNIIQSFNTPNEEFWKSIYTEKNVGSGGQLIISGWIKNLFFPHNAIAYPDSFSPCVSLVKYKNLSTGDKYVMQTGLFASHIQDTKLVPDFDYVVHKDDGE